MRCIIRMVTLGAIFLTALSAAAQTIRPTAPSTGVGGVGNTTDITLQFELTKEASVHILKAVSHQDVFDRTGRDDLKRFYLNCRESMFRGAVGTKFVVVDAIPDGGAYHALAQRRNNREIWISRTEMDRLSKAKLLNTGLLVQVFLHEVGHDCVIDGRRVDDRFDTTLNELGMALYQASRRQSQGSFLDLEFVNRVKQGSAVTYRQLSLKVQEQVSVAYINYLGDWLYKKNADRFPFRPAPASDFYASSETSVFAGWNRMHSFVPSVSREMNILVSSVMRASFDSKSLSYYKEFIDAEELPTRLSCQAKTNKLENLTYADCELTVFWNVLSLPELQAMTQTVTFHLDALGRVQVTGIRM